MSDQNTPEPINDATLELLERRIADKVTEQARKRVIGHYAVVGSTLAAVAAFVGWSVVGWVQHEAETRIDAKISALTAAINDKTVQVTNAQSAIAVRLGVLDDLSQHAGRTIDKVDETLQGFAPKSRRLEQAASDIAELEERVRPIRGTIEQAEQNRTDLERVSGQLNTLAQQVAQLITVAQQAPASGPAPAAGTFSSIAAATAGVATGSASIAKDIAANRAMPTVYVQFSGFQREMIDLLRQQLAAKGFNVPAAERTGAATKLAEVRYFHEGDRTEAERLARLTTEALRSLVPTDAREVKAANSTGYGGTKPKPATLELWYGPSA